MINKDLKVAVLGAGAMGCLFGGLLAEKGLNVILIDVWKEHVDAINKDGLKMDGHGGDRVIKVKHIYRSTEPNTQSKFPITATKSARRNPRQSRSNNNTDKKSAHLIRHLVKPKQNKQMHKQYSPLGCSMHDKETPSKNKHQHMQNT